MLTAAGATSAAVSRTGARRDRPRRPLARLLLWPTVICLACLLYQMTNITFGLPGRYADQGRPVPYWFNDEVKEVAQIRSFLEPRAAMLHFNYPPLQYLIVAAVLSPARVITGQVPADWVISLTARCLSAMAVALSSLLLYLIGGRLNAATGALAAVLFAVAPISAVLARDVKPIALAGVFLLVAIHQCLAVIERGPSGGRYRRMGAALGLSLTCSHLAVAYLHLPLLAHLFAQRVAAGPPPVRRTDLEIVPGGRMARIVAWLAGAGAAGMTVALGVLLLEKDRMLGLAREVYGRQQHAKPFEAHLPLIENLYGTGLLIVGLAGAGLVLLLVYLQMRPRLSRTRLLQSLVNFESAYGTLAVTAAGVMAFASMLNPLIPLSVFNFLRNARLYAGAKVGYYGLYPGELTPPSFFSEIFSAALGPGLLIAGAVGAALFLVPRSRRWQTLFLVLVFAPFAVQIALWNENYRASRFAYTFFFFLVLAAAYALTAPLRRGPIAVRSAGGVLVAVVVAATLAHSLAYVSTLAYGRDARVKAARWILEQVPAGRSLGVEGAADLPRNTGPAAELSGYTYLPFDRYPDYCIVDGYEYHVLRQYFQRTGAGYVYRAADWLPSERPPRDEDFTAYDAILNEKRYRLRARLASEEPQRFGGGYNLRLLGDPAADYHRECYVFERTSPAGGAE